MLASKQDKHLYFKTKAENLLALSERIKCASILPILIIQYKDWIKNRDTVLNKLKKLPFSNQKMIVRSSAAIEDSATESNAGKFHSELNVDIGGLKTSIHKVFQSYGESLQPEDILFIQPMLQKIHMSGVLLTKQKKHSRK